MRIFPSLWLTSALLVTGLTLGGCASDNGDGMGSAGNFDNPGSSDGSSDGSGDGSSSGDGSGDGSASGGSGDDSASGGTSPNTAPTSGPAIPQFPGAGTSDAAEPLQGGMLCDSVAGDQELPVIEDPATCFFGPETDGPAATLEQVLECVEDTNAVHIRLTFHPWFVDNTYGEGSIGWPPVRGHRFRDLTASDHAEIILEDADGNVAMQFKLDYISADDSAPSGYASLGVTGGDGNVTVGEADWILDYRTSLERNLNERGYSSYTTDSPITDENYTPNPDTPDWDYRLVYEAWIDLAAFDGNGFGGALIEYVHASPAKSQSDTIEVTPGECPPPPTEPPSEECPTNDPDHDCSTGDPPPPPGEDDTTGDDTTGDDTTGDDTTGDDTTGDDTTGDDTTGDDCVNNDPDADCGSGDPPPPPGEDDTTTDMEQHCLDNPDDPACNVD